MRGRVSMIIVSEEPAMQALATRHLHLQGGRITECAMSGDITDAGETL